MDVLAAMAGIQRHSDLGDDGAFICEYFPCRWRFVALFVGTTVPRRCRKATGWEHCVGIRTLINWGSACDERSSVNFVSKRAGHGKN